MALKWITAIFGVLLAVQVSAEEMMPIKTQKDRLSYSIGASIGRNFRQEGVDVDTDLLMKGLKDAVSGRKLLVTEDDLRATMSAFQSELRRKQVNEKRLSALDNKKEGDAFLSENRKKEGVMTLPSGLQYKVFKMGDGRKPTDTDTIECHYRGTFINGTEFDSSYQTGKPATLKVSGVIPGWKEALKLMPVGSKWQLFVPPELAYGPRGSGRDIGPNATLIFEIELLEIKN
jgi:FKBP-type peptidyl-prolyl cis-trans isomerase